MSKPEKYLGLLCGLLAGCTAVWGADRPVVDIGPNYLEPSGAYVTPHIAWANPRAGGPLRALFIGERKRMREAVELAQRLELDYACYGLEYYNFPLRSGYFRGGYYRDDEPGARETHLWRLLFTRPRYDLIVLGVLDWNKFPEYARAEILRQVSAGTGLIRMATGRGAETDGLLRAALAARWEETTPAVSGVPWQFLPVFAERRDHADLEREMLRISRHGAGIIVSIAGYESAAFQLVAPGFSIASMEGKVPEWWGRKTPAEKARYHELDMPFENVRLTDYEYYLAWMVKLMLFAARQPDPIRIFNPDAVERVSRADWQGLSFEVQSAQALPAAGLAAEWALRDRDGAVLRRGAAPLAAGFDGARAILKFDCAPPPAGQYFADLWIRRGERTLAFGSRALAVTGALGFAEAALAAPAFSVKAPVCGHCRLTGPAGAAGPLKLRFCQTDSLGRLVRVSAQAVAGPEVAFTLPPAADPLAIVQFLDLELWDGADLVDRRRLPFSYSDLQLDDGIRLTVWQRPETSYLSMRLHQRLYEIGFEASSHFKLQDSLRHDYFGMGEHSTFKVGRFEIAAWANLQFMPPVGRFADVTMELKDTNSVWLDHAGRERLLIKPGERHPCLNDPRYRELCRRRARAVVDHYAPYSARDFFFDQEPSFCQAWQRPAGDQELCFCVNCVNYFRDYLHRTYGGIARLNAEYETNYGDFDDIQPVRLAAAVQNPGLAPQWADFRLAMDESHAAFYQELTGIMRAVHPEIRTGVAAPIWFGLRSADAGDMWRMSRWQQLAFPYYHLAGQMNIDFALPDSLVSLGTLSGWGPAYSRSMQFTGLNPWRELFAGANLFDVYYGDTGGVVLAADLTLYRDFQHLMDQLLEIKGGVGQLFQLGRRDCGGVAVLYSPASVHYAALATGDVVARGAMDRKYRAWAALLLACNQPFRFVSHAELADGVMDGAQYRLLILPGVFALAPDEADRILRFARDGGAVLADLRPGVADGHCKPYRQAPLDELFGVRQETGLHWPAERPLVMPAGMGATGAVWLAASDAALQVAAGRPDAGWGGGVVVRHDYGRGRGLLLNMALDGFASSVTHEHHWPACVNTNALGIIPHARGWLDELGARRPVELVPAVTGVTGQVFADGGNRYVGLLPEMPEILINYAAGSAQPTPPLAVTAALGGDWHVYDVRRREYLGFTNHLALQLMPGRAMALACLPYRVTALDLTVPATARSGEPISYQAVLRVTGKPGRHVFAVNIQRPDGTCLRPYARAVVCEDGAYTGTWTPALNDLRGRYVIRVRDVASGMESAAEVELTGPDPLKSAHAITSSNL